MSYLKKQISLILITMTVISCVNTKAITMPLKLNNYKQLAVSVSYGTHKCSIDASIYTNECSTSFIGGFNQQEENCGVEHAQEGLYVRRAPFQLSNTEANLSYEFSPRYVSNFLCLGYSTSKNNILVQLFQSGKIKEKVIFFSLNQSKSENGPIGSIDIGSPNNSLIGKGTKIVELEKIKGRNTHTTSSLKGFEYLGKPLGPHIDINYTVSFSQFQPHITMPDFIYDDFIQLLNQKYFYVQYYKFAQIPSIDKLEPLEISLNQKDGGVFTITIQPSQYTRPLPSGGYELLITTQGYQPYGDIVLGYNVFESYYVGFYQEGQKTVIAKKAQQSANNFRGSFNISE